MSDKYYLNALGIVNAMGSDKAEIRRRLLAAESPGMGLLASHLTRRTFFAGAVSDSLPAIPPALSAYACRNNRLALAAGRQIETAIEAARRRYSAARIGVVIGTSTSGVDEAEKALAAYRRSGGMPADFDYLRQEIGACADFLALYYRLEGPAFAISTACSSSGKVFASARSLIQAGLCDAVLVGGVDTLCELTLNGFAALEAISPERCQPFSRNRQGINIGEAAALFLMSREDRGPCFEGAGESADAWHMSAPEPSGVGARAAMQAALRDAGLAAADIGYINLHGTGTRLNDSMESHAVHGIFGDATPCSSTKPLTGHALGAAGATEAALCWLLLDHEDDRCLAPHLYDGAADPELSRIGLCASSRSKSPVLHAMSNSFAFGGNNVSIILGRRRHD